MEYDMEKAEKLEDIFESLADHDGAEEGELFSCFAGIVRSHEYAGHQYLDLIDCMLGKLGDYLSQGIGENVHPQTKEYFATIFIDNDLPIPQTLEQLGATVDSLRP